MNQKIKRILILLIIIYGIICLLLYLGQGKLLFHPTALPQDYAFGFNDTFEEVTLKAPDGVLLNGLHFKSTQKKGAVLFLHGNAGANHGWGQSSILYTQTGYDVFYLDYRSYGKSEGSITSETQLIQDAQLAYDYLKKSFDEKDIIVSGTSVGTGIAAIIAANNHPKTLILNSPYSSLSKLIMEKVKIVPPFLIKYRLKTNEHLKEVKCPIYILHGDEDKVIPFHHALRLKEQNKAIDLTTLAGFGHNDIMNSELYFNKTVAILEGR